MKISVATQTYKSSFGDSVILCDETTQTEQTEEGEKVVSLDAVDPPSDNEITETVSPRKDLSFVQPKSDDVSNDSQSDTEASEQLNLSFLVFKQELDKIRTRCPECGAAVRKRENTTQGTQLLATLKCINGYTHTWKSQPMIKGKADGNLLMSSGATYTKIAKILKLSFFQ